MFNFEILNEEDFFPMGFLVISVCLCIGCSYTFHFLLIFLLIDLEELLYIIFYIKDVVLLL